MGEATSHLLRYSGKDVVHLGADSGASVGVGELAVRVSHENRAAQLLG